MKELDNIAEEIHLSFEATTAARERALTQARTLTRHCATSIRAVHRDEQEEAQRHLIEAAKLAKSLRSDLVVYPDLYYAGYTQDALKEFAEASIVYALVTGENLPSPGDLNLANATYLNGLAESVGELRRRCLDILRHGYSEEAERLMAHMDDIYAVLTTMDYPDAITGGLRRQTDIVRSVTERTRGDLTLSLRQQHLEQTMNRLEDRLSKE
jgi:translin